MTNYGGALLVGDKRGVEMGVPNLAVPALGQDFGLALIPTCGKS